MGKIGASNSNTCLVPQCKSRSTNEISLFSFPKDETQRKKWADAIKIENKITQNMQVCSRHFVKSDYIISDNAGAKTKRLKRSAVPTQNLPWQFPNKRVSPTLAKARMERLKNRSLQKISDSPGPKSETPAKKAEGLKKGETTKKSEPEETVDEKKEQSKDTEDNIKEEDNSDDEITSENTTTSVDPDVGKDDEKDNEEESKEAVDENGGDATEAKKDDMPVRAPTRLRQREGLLKCEFCGRKCLTPQALQTHQHIAHKNARNNLFNTKKDSPAINNTKSSPKMPLISVKSPENLLAKPPLKVKSAEKSLNSSEVEKVLEEDSDYLHAESDSETSVKEEVIEKQCQRKTEFECPLCKRRFAVYFMAFKHIQKQHVGPNGSKELLPKPNRLDICTECDTSIEGDVHHCVGPLKLAVGLTCTGCEIEYKTLTMFDMHKSSKHSEGVESMFFSTLDQFQQWKTKMEKQTRTKYTILDQNDTKTIHRCSHRVATGLSRHRMCPSCIVVQEFTKGFQIHYYPIHYDHSYQKYNLGNAFKKYSITSLMNLTARQLPDSEDEAPNLSLGLNPKTEEAPEDSPDLYVQFQKITETLVNEAARINVNGLKQLMRKALEMIAIVNNYVEDEDDDGITSSNSFFKLDTDKDDLQEEVRTALSSLKRKSEMIDETPVKRKKPVFQSTENLKTPKSKTPSLNTEVKRNEPVKFNQSPKFIDTFQDFVGTLAKPDEKKKRVSDKKAPVKTKIGQFKPKTSPKKVSFSPTTPESPKMVKLKMEKVKELEYEVKEQENDCNILILKI